MSTYGDKGATDELYDRAARLVVRTQRPSISMLQRSLRIGFTRACDLIDTMEQDGLISAPNNCGQRAMRVKADYFVAVDAEIAKVDGL